MTTEVIFQLWLVHTYTEVWRQSMNYDPPNQKVIQIVKSVKKMCDIIFCRLTCSLAVPTCFNPSQNQSWLVSRQIHRRLEHSTKRLGTSIIFRRNMFYLFDYLLSFCCWLHPLFPFRTSTFLLGISIDCFFHGNHPSIWTSRSCL